MIMRAKTNIITSACLLLILAASGCNSATSDQTTSEPLVVDFPAAYVVLGQQGGLAVINLETQELAGTLPLKKSNGLNVSWPHHISLNPDHTKIAVGVVGSDLSGGHGGHGGHGSAGGSVVVIDAATGATLASRDFPTAIHNAAFSNDGSTLWFAEMSETGNVKVVNAQTLADESTIAVGAMPAEVTFSNDGHLAFVANGESHSVTVIDAVSKQVIRTVPVGMNPVGAWPGQNGWMFVDNEDSHSISAFQHDSTTVCETIDLGFKPGYAAFLQSRNELWVSNSTDGSVAIFVRADTAWTLSGDVQTGTDAHAIAFTSDGGLALVTNQGDGTVSVISTATRTKLKDITVGNKPNGIVLRDQ